jgi:signal transduction histidine kinase
MGPFLGLPIVRAGRNLANLYLARKQGEPAFSEDDERAAEMLAAYVAVAIGNARLYNQALAATRAREDLLTTVSHDLRNPLAAIRISTEMLRRAAGESGASHIAARIDRSTERMARLIADLLDASKIEAGVLRTTPQPEDAASLVNSAAEMFRVLATEKSIRLFPVAPSHCLAVLCERSSATQSSSAPAVVPSPSQPRSWTDKFSSR